MLKLHRCSVVAIGLGILLLGPAAPAFSRSASVMNGPALGQAEAPEYPELPGFGKKCQIDDNFYFTYEFAERPKMGTAILRVRVFDPEGNQSAPFSVIGRSDMPAMAGAHDSGDQEFKLNKRGDYLLPVNIVMPGEWEVKLTFKRGDAIVVRGAFRFDV
jgi:hypothetical protein